MSRFVSAGAKDEDRTREDPWQKARQQVEAEKAGKTEQAKQDDGKSLYEVLQQNKAAKQEAFEESIRLKNQIRTLDDEEIEFLDSIDDATRTKEAEVKKETARKLEEFRKQREAADQASIEGESSVQPNTESSIFSNEWATRRKNKREKDLGSNSNLKRRRLSSTSGPGSNIPSNSIKEERQKPQNVFNIPDENEQMGIKAKNSLEPSKILPEKSKQATPNLGLAAYSSDED